MIIMMNTGTNMYNLKDESSLIKETIVKKKKDYRKTLIKTRGFKKEPRNGTRSSKGWFYKKNRRPKTQPQGSMVVIIQ